MKLRDVANRGRVDEVELEAWMKRTRRYRKLVRDGFFGATIDDDADVDAILSDFKRELGERELQRAEEQARLEEQARKKQEALDAMIVTSGAHIEGYTIKKYADFISGDGIVQIPRTSLGFFDSGDSNTHLYLQNALYSIRQSAISQMKEKAYNLGCNAIVGIDFDYITLEPETANNSGGTTYEPYVICLTANGNAVIIEQNRPSRYPE